MYSYNFIETATSDFINVLEAGLNQAFPNIAPRNFLNLNIELLSDNQLIGGLAATTYWNWLHIKLLWISPDFRNQGLGKELVIRAEKEAINRSCIKSLVDTFSFQAPNFYESLGYQKFAELDDFPIGHKRIYFQKDLR